MKCPLCLGPTRVTDTRTPEGARIRWVMKLAEMMPLIVVRRRRCEAEHGTFVTAEIPLANLKDMEARCPAFWKD